jgi:hypothetical protein
VGICLQSRANFRVFRIFARLPGNTNAKPKEKRRDCMASLTTKELSSIEDQLNIEQVLIKKFNMYANQISDPQLRSKCQDYASRHQQHYNTLLKTLQ